jgi:hypothetical protein
MFIVKLSMDVMPLLSILIVYTVLYLHMVLGSGERILAYSVGS